uniref:Splicing coactivator subunit-like n=1 Tax=Oryza sativa subsp. japonica TaxID=39947 RepID=Q6Z041_ORYSJ|nr:splicing coactivator subunit-like [Oryza sativa Japonica Group]BAC92546.1 splicing coactivator subunit-like [Oryza sativa Japonica Group]
MVDRVHRRAHQSAPWAPRVNRTRGHRRLTAGPHAVTTRHARRRLRRRCWREAAAVHRRGGAAAERGEGKGERGGGPRLTPGRRWRRRRRPEWREAVVRLGSTGSAAFWRSATETEGWTRSARTWRSRRRRH